MTGEGGSRKSFFVEELTKEQAKAKGRLSETCKASKILSDIRDKEQSQEITRVLEA